MSTGAVVKMQTVQQQQQNWTRPCWQAMQPAAVDRILHSNQAKEDKVYNFLFPLCPPFTEIWWNEKAKSVCKARWPNVKARSVFYNWPIDWSVVLIQAQQMTMNWMILISARRTAQKCIARTDELDSRTAASGGGIVRKIPRKGKQGQKMPSSIELS